MQDSDKKIFLNELIPNSYTRNLLVQRANRYGIQLAMQKKVIKPHNRIFKTYLITANQLAEIEKKYYDTITDMGKNTEFEFLLDCIKSKLESL